MGVSVFIENESPATELAKYDNLTFDVSHPREVRKGKKGGEGKEGRE